MSTSLAGENGNGAANTGTSGAGWSDVEGAQGALSRANSLTPSSNAYVTFAASDLSDTINLTDISVGVITTALENVAFLRAQNGGVGSRLNFAYEILSQQRTNMRAALGRMIDVDIAEESTNLAKYNVLAQGAASMIAQANASTDLALILLR
jgi:flagellin